MKAPGSELTPRRARILGAIVEEFVRSGLPVGSKTVRESRELNVSTATIRNEMSALEEGGFIQQPHTSAGRVPSDRGYRAYVDLIMTPQPPRDEVIAWMRGEYRRTARDPESLFRTTSRVLSRVTAAPAMVLAPLEARQVLTALRLAPVSATIVLLTYETAPGGPHECLLQCEEPVTASEVAALGRALAERFCGRGVGALSLCTAQMLEGDTESFPVPASLLHQVKLAVEGDEEQRVYVDGAALSLNYPEYRELSHLRPVMEALDEERMVRRLLRPAGRQDAVLVTIGQEQEVRELRLCSIVARAYRGAGSRSLGVLGVLGPTRMNYQAVTAAVTVVAREVSEALTRACEEEEEG